MCVRDRGAGIAPEKLRHIFDRLYTQEDSRSSALGGSGLGLAIAQSIVLRHGGRIWAQSRQGVNTFSAELPMA